MGQCSFGVRLVVSSDQLPISESLGTPSHSTILTSLSTHLAHVGIGDENSPTTMAWAAKDDESGEMQGN